MVLEDFYKKHCKNSFTKIKIENFLDFMEGEDLELAKHIKSICERGQCHWNAGQAVLHKNLFKDWDITFCEGLYLGIMGAPIEHCWNKVTSRANGETHYIDFTIGAGEALLLEEWYNDEIIELFDSAKNAFVPFKDYWDYLDIPKARKILSRHYIF
jgi:hypothetical protein